MPQTIHRNAGIISIHAAREGGDLPANKLNRLTVISIHAAREGGDLVERYHAHADSDFNPRRP